MALPRGIRIFWRKHNLITNVNIRESRDEELVAHLLSAILIEPRPASTSKNLDKFYNENQIIDKAISKLGEEYVIKMFEAVFEEFRRTFESTSSSFYRVLFKKETSYLNRSFQVFFLAFYDLLVKEQFKILDYQKLCKSLEGIGDQYLTPNAESYKLSKKREDGVQVVKGLIRKYFVRRAENDPALNNGVLKLENILGGSQTENTNYDFKIGLHKIYDVGDFDETCFEKILKTLSAIANISKDSIGYVIIGVADKKSDSESHEKFYNVKSEIFKSFYITGVQEEAKKYKSHDEYRNKIENKIRQSAISPSKYIDQILRNIDYFDYYGKSILLLKIVTDGEPVKFGDNYYERQGTSTIQIPREKEVNLWQRMLK